MTRWVQPDSHGPIVESLADTLKAGLVEFVASLEEALDECRKWASPLPGSGGENGPRGSDVSDPTGNAATAEHRKEERHTYRLLLSHIETATTSVNDIRRIVDRCRPPDTATSIARWQKAQAWANKLADCATATCPRQSPLGDRYCEACQHTLDRNPGMKRVPADTIKEREKKLKQRHRETARGVYVSGPFEGELAHHGESDLVDVP